MTGTEETGNALVVAPALNAVTTFTVKDGSKSVLENIRAQVKALPLDISTEAGRKQIKSVARKLGSVKAELDDAGKTLKADMQAQVNLVDGERKIIRDGIEALQEEIKAPLVEFEKKEEERKQSREDRITAIKELFKFWDGQPTIENIDTNLSEVEELRDFDWQEFRARATSTADDVKQFLDNARAARVKHDADQAELERFRKAEEERIQKERDAEIAAEATRIAEEAAAETARVKAEEEKAEKERIQREADDAKRKVEEAETARVTAHNSEIAKMEEIGKVPDVMPSSIYANKRNAIKIVHDRDWQEFEAHAQQVFEAIDKELERLWNNALNREAEAKKIADKKIADDAEEAGRVKAVAAQKVIDDATAAREKDQEHRGKINREALDAIKEIIAAHKETGNDPSKALVEAIVRGKIPHVKINY